MPCRLAQTGIGCELCDEELCRVGTVYSGTMARAPIKMKAGRPARFAQWHPAHFREKFIGEDRNIGLCKSRGGENVHYALGRHRARDNLAHRVVQLLLRPRIAGRAFGEHCLHRLEKGDVVPDAQRFGVRHRQRKGLRQLAHSPQAAVLSVLLACDAGNRPSRSCGVPLVHFDQSKPWKKPQQISYFSSITVTASSWSSAVRPVPPLAV